MGLNKTIINSYFSLYMKRKPEKTVSEKKKVPIKNTASSKGSSDASAQDHNKLSDDSKKKLERTRQSRTHGKSLHQNQKSSYHTEMRLNKFLAHAGVASRRKADEIIRSGKITVNGQVVTEMGYKVMPGDQVRYQGKLLSIEPKIYVLLNKPKDYITTVKDEKGRKTVMDLIKGIHEKIGYKKALRLYPVGRLDRNTTGVLLITNDGEMSQQLTHPSMEIKKIYHVFLNKKLSLADFQKIADGQVILEDGPAVVDEIAFPNVKDKSEVGLEIHTGKNRFVRRLFEALGYEVVKLDRVYFAGLTKKDLPRGKWRFLTEFEVRMLKALCNKQKRKLAGKYIIINYAVPLSSA
ncbi:MAG: pseudouridine synthase [Chitinophagales bacterium]|nr:rRNA pseudouridine synthase [Chitinophagales bacterium]MDW8272670.1 pseudouridine synthase [Chitinophagales bacterium]